MGKLISAALIVRNAGNHIAACLQSTAAFARFIPAGILINDASARAQPIAAPAAFSRTIGPEGTDALLLRQTIASRPDA